MSTLQLDGEQLTRINVYQIDVDEQLIRRTVRDDQLEELALDIQRHGLLQPIGVKPAVASRYQLLWGRRRLEAHKLLRRETILARIVTTDGAQTRDIAARENLHRLQLSLEEECDVVARLCGEQGYSTQMTADALGKSVQWVQRRLAVPGYPVDLRDAVMGSQITLGAADLLAQIKDENMRAWLTNQTIIGRWTTLQTRRAVEQLLELPDVTDAVRAGVLAAQGDATAPAPHYACFACGSMQPIAKLRYVPICALGCSHDPATTSGD